jgi:Kef-type K+ transport system membrane component KefB
LLLLMFCSGIEIRSSFDRSETRTVASIFVVGMVVPFLAGLGFLSFIDEAKFLGPHGGHLSFLLVFAIAMAVTSIPVISRIMFDLGILGTPFARIVLGVAVAEDIVLYVVLAVALGIAAQAQGALFGIPAALGFVPGTAVDMVYHSAVTVGVLISFVTLGPWLYRATSTYRFNLVQKRSPIAYQLVFMMVACLIWWAPQMRRWVRSQMVQPRRSGISRSRSSSPCTLPSWGCNSISSEASIRCSS